MNLFWTIWLASIFSLGMSAAMTMNIVAQTIGEVPSITVAQEEPPALTLAEQRTLFQTQELMTSKSGSWIFQPGNTPRIIWRDVDEVRRLGGEVEFHVRWFNSRLEELPEPNDSGRWMAWIEGTAPNGTPFRRAHTFYAIPKDLNFAGGPPDLTVEFPRFPGKDLPVQWQEHRDEVTQLASALVLRSLDTEQAAILIAGINEAKPLGHQARFVESVSVMNDDMHLALKLKVQALADNVRGLQPPRVRAEPATKLHEGSTVEAGVRPDAKSMIDEFCQAWADETGEPFVTLVAKRGVLVTHRAFGSDAKGQLVDLNYRCWTASTTKTVTGLMFSQFVDQQLVSLDDSLSKVFADYPKVAAYVPTFRQCLNHTSGLKGHSEFGGMKNPHLENVILNGLDINQPLSKYEYCGMGFELTAKAMEILAGKSAAKVYSEHLFEPLGFGDVRMGNASSDGEFTALELGILAQWVANRGSYGNLEFISPTTFDQLLPQPVILADRGQVAEYGMGIHWIRHLKPGAPPNSTREEDQLFSLTTVGHGSFSGCVFVVDLDQQLVITQVRKQLGPRHEEYWPKFFQMIAEATSDPVDGK